MGMTIDTAITVLGMVEAHGVCIEAKDIAVETMCKYQKIEQIISDGYLQGKSSVEMLLGILEIMNGNNTD